MQILDWITSKRIEKRELASLVCLVLLSTFTVALSAQSLSTPFGPTALNSPAHDITVAGTIQQLITTHTSGAPLGAQLVVDGPQGSFTANLGLNLRAEVQKSLSQGAPVQISGFMKAIDGKQFLMARTLTIADKQIVIRNENGVPVHPSQRSGVAANNSALYRSTK